MHRSYAARVGLCPTAFGTAGDLLPLEFLGSWTVLYAKRQ